MYTPTFYTEYTNTFSEGRPKSYCYIVFINVSYISSEKICPQDSKMFKISKKTNVLFNLIKSVHT